ncbi:MAG: NAD(P)H-dependent oxidoreductase [Pseudomonadota bacterium]
MKASIILAHPNQGSFNHAIAQTAVTELVRLGHHVAFHDLYAEGFDPVLPKGEAREDVVLPPFLEEHCREICSADGIVVVHPNWWGQPPAIMKGWIDRVFRPGRAYRFLEGDKGEGIPVGLLKAKAVLVFNTANTPSEREQEEFGDPLERLWKDCLFSFCGVRTFQRVMFTVIVTSTPEQRQQWLDQAGDMVRRHFPAD